MFVVSVFSVFGRHRAWIAQPSCGLLSMNVFVRPFSHVAVADGIAIQKQYIKAYSLLLLKDTSPERRSATRRTGYRKFAQRLPTLRTIASVPQIKKKGKQTVRSQSYSRMSPSLDLPIFQSGQQQSRTIKQEPWTRQENQVIRSQSSPEIPNSPFQLQQDDLLISLNARESCTIKQEPQIPTRKRSHQELSISTPSDELPTDPIEHSRRNLVATPTPTSPTTTSLVQSQSNCTSFLQRLQQPK